MCRDEESRTGWRTSSRTGGYVEFSGTAQAFQTGQTGGKCRRLLLLAGGGVGGCRSTRVCEGFVIPLLCTMYMRPSGQGASLNGKSNVGRFDCVPRHLHALPQAARGCWEARGRGWAGRILRSLACAGCDVERRQAGARCVPLSLDGAGAVSAASPESTACPGALHCAPLHCAALHHLGQ